MDTERIIIPDDLKAFVQSQIDAGNFRDAADYVRYLIRADQENCRMLEEYASDSRVGDLIAEGLASGDSRALDLESVRKELNES